MRSTNVLATLLGLALFAVFILGAYYLIRFGLGLFDGLSAEVAAVTAIGAITLLVSALVVAGGLRGSARREVERRQHATRAKVYDRFLAVWATAPEQAHLLGSDHAGPAEEMRVVERQMALHASTDVLKAYLRLRRVAEGTSEADADAQREWARLVRAMRKDLGQRAPDVGLPQVTELLRLREPTRA